MKYLKRFSFAIGTQGMAMAVFASEIEKAFDIPQLILVVVGFLVTLVAAIGTFYKLPEQQNK